MKHLSSIDLQLLKSLKRKHVSLDSKYDSIVSSSLISDKSDRHSDSTGIIS